MHGSVKLHLCQRRLWLGGCRWSVHLPPVQRADEREYHTLLQAGIVQQSDGGTPFSATNSTCSPTLACSVNATACAAGATSHAANGAAPFAEFAIAAGNPACSACSPTVSYSVPATACAAGATSLAASAAAPFAEFATAARTPTSANNSAYSPTLSCSVPATANAAAPFAEFATATASPGTYGGLLAAPTIAAATAEPPASPA